MADVEAQFKAALEVIENLPKNGPYKPSPDMMLLFYSYYKQATSGPCNRPKPWAFDVINKAKWDAWHKLGQMGRQEAMGKYVNELTKIIEVLPATDRASEFLQTLGHFYEVVDLKTAEAEQVKALLKKRDNKPLPNGNHLSNGTHNGVGDVTMRDGVMEKTVGSDSDEDFCDTSPDLQDSMSHNSSSSEPSTLSHDSYIGGNNLESEELMKKMSNKEGAISHGGESGTHGLNEGESPQEYRGPDERSSPRRVHFNPSPSPTRESPLSGNGAGGGDRGHDSQLYERIAIVLSQ
uniref:ACB domain-containing protein n=1 Tax=Ciona savignyi TaxID=51511 RepID=H2YKX8_CIOSA